MERGLPFREAHAVTGRIVAWCIECGKTLEEMETAEWQSFSPLFKSDIKRAISIRKSVDARKVYGGTASYADMPVGALVRNLGKLTEIGILAHGSNEAREVAETAAEKFMMWIEMQAEQADIAPELKGFEVDQDKRTITYVVPKEQPQGPQPVE